MDSLKNNIKVIWDYISKQVFQNIIENIRWEIFIKYNGRRMGKE